MKKGYITVQPMIGEDEIAWIEVDGSPVFYDTVEEAQQECDEDWQERLDEGMETEGSEENKDYVAYCIQLDEDRYAVYDVEDKDYKNILFIHNRKNCI